MKTTATLTRGPTVSPGFTLPRGGAPARQGARSALAALRAWWASRRGRAAARHVDEALGGLSPHVLRDIGAPDSLVACAVEREAARPSLADFELRA